MSANQTCVLHQRLRISVRTGRQIELRQRIEPDSASRQGPQKYTRNNLVGEVFSFPAEARSPKQTLNRHPELPFYGNQTCRSASRQIRLVFAFGDLSPDAAEIPHSFVIRGVSRDTSLFCYCRKGSSNIPAMLFSKQVEEDDPSCPSAIATLATSFAE